MKPSAQCVSGHKKTFKQVYLMGDTPPHTHTHLPWEVLREGTFQHLLAAIFACSSGCSIGYNVWLFPSCEHIWFRTTPSTTTPCGWICNIHPHWHSQFDATNPAVPSWKFGRLYVISSHRSRCDGRLEASHCTGGRHDFLGVAQKVRRRNEHAEHWGWHDRDSSLRVSAIFLSLWSRRVLPHP